MSIERRVVLAHAFENAVGSESDAALTQNNSGLRSLRMREEPEHRAPLGDVRRIRAHVAGWQHSATRLFALDRAGVALERSRVGRLPQSERKITSSSEPPRKPADGRRAARSPYAREHVDGEPILKSHFRSLHIGEERIGSSGKQGTTHTTMVAWARSKDVPRQRRSGCCVESRNRRCVDHTCRTRAPRRTTRVLRSDADRPRSKP